MGTCCSTDSANSASKKKHEEKKRNSDGEGSSTIGAEDEEAVAADLPRGGSVKLPPKKDARPAATSNGNSSTKEFEEQNSSSPFGTSPAGGGRPPPPPPSSRPVIKRDPEEEAARLKRIELMEEVSKPTVMDFGDLDKDEDDHAAGGVDGDDGADADAIILNFNDDFEEREAHGDFASGVSDENVTGASSSAGGVHSVAAGVVGSSSSSSDIEPPTDQWFKSNDLPLPVMEWYQDTDTVHITIKLGEEDDCPAGWDLENNEVLRCILHGSDTFETAMTLFGPCIENQFYIEGDAMCLKVTKAGPPFQRWTQLFKGSRATFNEISWLRRDLTKEEDLDEDTPSS